MIEYKDIYGADADGNRGIPVIEYELEPADNEEIKYEIITNLEDEEYHDSIEVHLLSMLTDELISFDVTISDYLTEEEFKGVKDEQNNY